MSSQYDNYTVGWICAIEPEYLAAQLCLDETHPGLACSPSPNDTNTYVLGKINNHNVVIACLPSGSYGTSSAANVAANMLRSFPNVRIGLMVGIGGGAPTPSYDIRLGDVVVSSPGDGRGGVFQHDFGKEIQERDFQETGFLNRPPTVLLTGVMSLKVDYKRKPGSLESAIDLILGKEEEELQEELKRPDACNDILCKSNYAHPANSKASCVEACGTDPANLVPLRPDRKRPRCPVVHYGLIASGDRLMKDALRRDELAEKWKVLCFEMEAAGLINDFPCMVIRGICDYSDSHKNKEWQGYAAMAAAAYAKDLLYKIPPNRVEAEEKISKVLSDLQGVVETHRDIAQQQLEVHQDQLVIQRHTVKQKLSDKQNKCLQLFRLTNSTEDATYEWYKDRVEDRVEDTCMWFLEHGHFQNWLKQESGPLLVSADPGCGKSVLAKHLIDNALPRSATICYFFFKYHDQDTVRQALCALLHQLFSQKPVLIKHAMKQFEKDGPGLINSSKSLWTILKDASCDAGPIIIVLDALDECAEPEFENLMRNVESQMRSAELRHGKLKYLLTSRPYEQIVSKFRGLLADFPRIHIPGEEESETISREVDRVIKFRVERLAREKALSDRVKDRLAGEMLKLTHRTYLWVYLVFDYLKNEDFKKTLKGVHSSIKALPKNVNEAYERILNKSKEHLIVRKALSIILAASRPLTLSEMNIAINITEEVQTFHDLDLEEEDDFKSSLRSWCGLFVSVYHDKVYFLHQTAREFLLANLPLPSTISMEPRWRRSITMCQAHNILADVCVRYLNFFVPASEASPQIYSQSFLEYSARFWGLHFREARIDSEGAAIVPIVLMITDPDGEGYSVWSKIYWKGKYPGIPRKATGLIVAAYLGHTVIVKLLLAKGSNINAQDGEYGNALQAASFQGHESVVKLLIDKDANVNAQSGHYGNALQAASAKGHESVVKLLIDKDANVNAQSGHYSNALLAALAKGHESVVKLLINKDADVNAQSRRYGNALHAASARGYELVVELLIDKGANINARGGKYGNALYAASHKGHYTVVKLLINKGANINARDGKQSNALWAASHQGHYAVVKLLINEAASINAYRDYVSALYAASSRGHKAIVELLHNEAARQL